jgi:hypothetical protein
VLREGLYTGMIDVAVRRQKGIRGDSSDGSPSDVLDSVEMAAWISSLDRALQGA